MVVVAVLAVLCTMGSTAAFNSALFRTTSKPPRSSRLQSSMDSYLSSLSAAGETVSPLESPLPNPAAPVPPVHSMPPNNMMSFAHAPISYFAIDQLEPKGPRKGADVGQPHDATRPLTKVGSATGSTSAGSWWCAKGGWPSLTQRTTTEVFYVFYGHGCLTDMDGTRHFFGPGDTVVLPKGWAGRWDVLEDIHKVWFVHDHPNIEERSNPIRAVITPYSSLAPKHLQNPQDDTFGAPRVASNNIYDVGPTRVGSWIGTPGSFPVNNLSYTEGFHVLEGNFFLTNADGSAHRCEAGDTVMLPKGWSGHWDIIETVTTLGVIVA